MIYVVLQLLEGNHNEAFYEAEFGTSAIQSLCNKFLYQLIKKKMLPQRPMTLCRFAPHTLVEYITNFFHFLPGTPQHWAAIVSSLWVLSQRWPSPSLPN